jgi:hypothetical protein
MEDAENINPMKNFENRYYYDLDQNISVQFFMYNGVSLRGHFHPWIGWRDVRRTPMIYYEYPLWDMRLEQCVADKIGRIKTPPYTSIFNNSHYLVMNVGYNDLQLFNLNRPNDLRNVAATAVGTYDKFLWRTTTHLRPGAEHDVTWGGTREDHDKRDKLVCGVEGVLCMDTAWTKDLSAEDYYDNKHLKANAVHRMNQEMYEILSRT